MKSLVIIFICAVHLNGCAESSSQAHEALCGNGIIEEGEVCDGDDFGEQTCQNFGATRGRLLCSDNCTFVDDSACEGQSTDDGICGNGLVEGNEQCDSAPPELRTCESLGYPGGGQLGCTRDCTINETLCRLFQCGNAKCETDLGEDVSICCEDCCPQGTICDADLYQCVPISVCPETCSSPNSKRCIGDQLESCTNTNCWTLVDTCDCGCEQGACLPTVCAPGAVRCNNNVEICSGDGCIWEIESLCQNGCEGTTCLSICEEDNYEPNNISTGAILLPILSTVPNLTICSGDVDWFKVPVSSGDQLQVVVNFSNSSGDIDAGIYKENGTLIKQSTSTDNGEQILFTASSSEYIYIKIYGYNNAENEYTLTIVSNGGGITIPGTWTCNTNYYNNANGCDCNCGAYDPDCDVSTATIYGCTTGQTCNSNGQCISPQVPSAGTRQLFGSSAYRAIPSGTFTMGSPPSELFRYDTEIQHQVTLTRGFWLKETEVTQAEWRAVMGNSPSVFSACGDNCPVENVNWWDAVQFCNALSVQQGLSPCYSLVGCNATPDSTCNSILWDTSCTGFRLPTEAEWEWAYRAGTTSALYTGQDFTQRSCSFISNVDNIGWYCGNSGVAYSGCSDLSSYGGPSCAGTHPVASKQSNAWGIHDMAGNVSEFCWNWYVPYSSSPQIDPIGPLSSPTGAGRVTRGGGYGSYASFLRAAFYNEELSTTNVNRLGFRIAKFF